MTLKRFFPAALLTALVCMIALPSLHVIFAGDSPAPAAPADKASVEVKLTGGTYRISGPYTVKNLNVFLLHGPDTIKDKDFLTLGEAMEGKKITVEETGTVNTLIVQNTGDVTIYILGGEIVKGGKQDRVLQHDIIVPPGKKLSISAFCVEQGRWSARGKEDVKTFNSSSNVLSSKGQKLAARVSGKQNEVWDKVSVTQDKLSKSAGESVKARESESSLELTLGNKKLAASLDEYTKELSGLLDGRKDVVGYGFIINGQINSVDIYGSAALFRKFWPKLLKAAATEALEDYQGDSKFVAGTPEDIKKFMLDADKAEKTREKVTERTVLEKRDAPSSIMLESKDAQNDDVTVRKSIINKN